MHRHCIDLPERHCVELTPDICLEEDFTSDGDLCGFILSHAVAGVTGRCEAAVPVRSDATRLGRGHTYYEATGSLRQRSLTIRPAFVCGVHGLAGSIARGHWQPS